MRNDRRKIKFQFDGIGRIGISSQVGAIFPPRVNLCKRVSRSRFFAARSRSSIAGESCGARLEISNRHFVKREKSGECSPFCCHVGDCHARIHRKRGNAIAKKFDSVIQDLVVIEQSAECDDHIFPCDSSGKFSAQENFRNRGDLPPRHASRPDARSVGSHNWCAQSGDRAVEIGMRIASDNKRAWNNISLLDHHLMADASAWRVVIHTVLACKGLNLGVFAEVFWSDILNVVIDRKDGLRWISDFRRADLLELWNDCACVVVSHHVAWTD